MIDSLLAKDILKVHDHVYMSHMIPVHQSGGLLLVSTAQRFLVPSPAGLMSIFYCLAILKVVQPLQYILFLYVPPQYHPPPLHLGLPTSPKWSLIWTGSQANFLLEELYSRPFQPPQSAYHHHYKSLSLNGILTPPRASYVAMRALHSVSWLPVHLWLIVSCPHNSTFD